MTDEWNVTTDGPVITQPSAAAGSARQHGIKRPEDSDSIAKLFAAYLRHIEEAPSVACWYISGLHAATRQNTTQVLRDAAGVYKLDPYAVTLTARRSLLRKMRGARFGGRVRKCPPKQ